MAKKVTKILKMVVPGGKAAPGVPLGPVLGGAGVNIGEFIKQFNEATADKGGMLMNVILTAYDDRSFTFELKSPPASALLKKAAGIEKGSGKNAQSRAGRVTRAQVRAIATEKLPDLNCVDVDSAMKIIEGSARSMGIQVVE